MADDPFLERLRRLEERHEASRSGGSRNRGGRGEVEGSALGWRMVTELVVGMLVGFAIGYGLDSLFGTRPVFLVIFALLGFAAGVRTMMRTAAEEQRRRIRRRDEAAGGGGNAQGAGGGGNANTAGDGGERPERP
jgi:ATP synthase protein I